MEQLPREGKPELDAVSRGAQELFEKHQVGALQEVSRIDRATKVLAKYIAEGKLTPQMTLEEAIEILDNVKEELLGPEEDAE